MERKAVEVVAALIWDKDRFMICQRPAHKARGLLWEFVGGKVEAGETKEDALIRECREELDVTVAPGGVFTDVLHEYPDITVHLTLIHARIAAGTPKLLEHNDLRWITPEEIPAFPFCPADETILSRIRAVYEDPGVGRVRERVLALRDPKNLAVDMLEEKDWVKKALTRSAAEFFAAYGVFYQMIHEVGMPTTSWTPIIHDGTFYIPSNDFSCMISKAMYDEVFLPGIAQECAFYERSIYHLDGPGALRHLDSLLEIKELDAVQWVCGVGNEGYHRWAGVYQKIQRAGKGIQLMCHVKELDQVFETLRPEGVWFSSIGGVKDRETAEYAVRRIEKWRLAPGG